MAEAEEAQRAAAEERHKRRGSSGASCTPQSSRTSQILRTTSSRRGASRRPRGSTTSAPTTRRRAAPSSARCSTRSKNCCDDRPAERQATRRGARQADPIDAQADGGAEAVADVRRRGGAGAHAGFTTRAKERWNCTTAPPATPRSPSTSASTCCSTSSGRCGVRLQRHPRHRRAAIDREADMLNRGRSEASLTGARKRLRQPSKASSSRRAEQPRGGARKVPSG